MCMAWEDAIYAMKRMIRERDTESPRFAIAFESLEMQHQMLQRDNGILRENWRRSEDETMRLRKQLFELRKGIDDLANKAGDETAKKFREHIEKADTPKTTKEVVDRYSSLMGFSPDDAAWLAMKNNRKRW